MPSPLAYYLEDPWTVLKKDPLGAILPLWPICQGFSGERLPPNNIIEVSS